MTRGPTILHADLDAFYASVEQLLDPALRGRPIAVGGGVVLAASYEAKRFGVRGGMAGWRAKQACPDLLFVNGHFSEYQRLGDRVIEVLNDFTPLVQRISIDEAFLDVSGAIHLFGPAEAIGRQIRARVRDEIGLPISVGAAGTKHLAKIASQVAKPDGMVVVPIGGEREFLDPLPVGLIWGVGPVMQRRLAERGVFTIRQLRECSDEGLRSLLGRALGTKVGVLAANDDGRRVETGPRASSVGAQSAIGRRDIDGEVIRVVLGHLADRIAGRLRSKHRAGRTVTVRVRFPGMRAVTRSATFGFGINTTRTLAEVAEHLVHAALGDNPGEQQITLLAISVSNLVDQPVLQLELALDPLPSADGAPRPGSRVGAARLAVDQSIDAVRRRFGRAAVGYASVVLSEHASVPDEFRELAEHEL